MVFVSASVKKLQRKALGQFIAVMSFGIKRPIRPDPDASARRIKRGWLRTHRTISRNALASGSNRPFLTQRFKPWASAQRLMIQLKILANDVVGETILDFDWRGVPAVSSPAEMTQTLAER